MGTIEVATNISDSVSEQSGSLVVTEWAKDSELLKFIFRRYVF